MSLTHCIISLMDIWLHDYRKFMELLWISLRPHIFSLLLIKATRVVCLSDSVVLSSINLDRPIAWARSWPLPSNLRALNQSRAILAPPAATTSARGPPASLGTLRVFSQPMMSISGSGFVCRPLHVRVFAIPILFPSWFNIYGNIQEYLNLLWKK